MEERGQVEKKEGDEWRRNWEGNDARDLRGKGRAMEGRKRPRKEKMIGKGTGRKGRDEPELKKEGDILALPLSPWPLTSLPLPPWLFPYMPSSFPSFFGSPFFFLAPLCPLRAISSLPFHAKVYKFGFGYFLYKSSI